MMFPGHTQFEDEDFEDCMLIESLRGEPTMSLKEFVKLLIADGLLKDKGA
jgi:hypothetical protein